MMNIRVRHVNKIVRICGVVACVCVSVSNALSSLTKTLTYKVHFRHAGTHSGDTAQINSYIKVIGSWLYSQQEKVCLCMASLCNLTQGNASSC